MASGAIGGHAIVIGAGVGGLSAARALADRFARVTVLERDALPAQPAARAGTPQCRHTHVLLGGGQLALEALFPGFADDLVAHGAVRYRVGRDLRLERAGFDPFPRRDLGWDGHAMSRPLVEYVARRRLASFANVAIGDRSRVLEITAAPDGAVTGVRVAAADGGTELLPADLVVDATGSGALSLALLDAAGIARPELTEIGVDLVYATAVFAIPEALPREWTGVLTYPDMRHTSRSGFLLPLEGQRWIVSLTGAHGDRPPDDTAGFLGFAASLRTPTIHDAIRGARLEGGIARFAFSGSTWRHFERLPALPRGLLPVADALCRFNPVYGQGMSVAAQEALALHGLLAAGAADALEGLAARFLAASVPLIEAPWAAAMLDFAYPQTRGERPAAFAQTLAFGSALTRLAAGDEDVHRLVMEVQHLRRPRSALGDPTLVRRVQAVMTAQ